MIKQFSSFLVILNIVLSFAANADCTNFKTKAYANLETTQKGEMDKRYSHIPFLLNLNQEDDLNSLTKKLSKNGDSPWSASVTCIDNHNVYFSLKLVDEEAPLMDGVYFIESGRYFSGPFSLISSDMLIIQADSL
jgi:hypothetical protein